MYFIEYNVYEAIMTAKKMMEQGKDPWKSIEVAAKCHDVPVSSVNQHFSPLSSEGVVTKIAFSESSPNASVILEKLIESGVLVDVLPARVCLKQDTGETIDRPTEMKGSDYDKIWTMLLEVPDKEMKKKRGG